MTSDKLHAELQASVQQTLMDYQSMKSQGSRIEELEVESQELQHLNQTLVKKVGHLKVNLQRAREIPHQRGATLRGAENGESGAAGPEPDLGEEGERP